MKETIISMGFSEDQVNSALERTGSYESALEFLLNPPVIQNCKMVFLIRTDLGMSAGKVAAQCCHAVLENYKQSVVKFPQYVQKWEQDGQTKITLKCGNESEMIDLLNKALDAGLIAEYVTDAGRTQIAANTKTVTCIGPAPADLINPITGHLELY